jgi:hypothetical protein
MRWSCRVLDRLHGVLSRKQPGKVAVHPREVEGGESADAMDRTFERVVKPKNAKVKSEGRQDRPAPRPTVPDDLQR